MSDIHRLNLVYAIKLEAEKILIYFPQRLGNQGKFHLYWKYNGVRLRHITCSHVIFLAACNLYVRCPAWV